MKILEFFETVHNEFIHKNLQTPPEEIKPSENYETELDKALRERGRLIRRYRAYAYHHKKRRIRKKYLKKLIKISPIDRVSYLMAKSGCTEEELAKALNEFAGMIVL